MRHRPCLICLAVSAVVAWTLLYLAYSAVSSLAWSRDIVSDGAFIDRTASRHLVAFSAAQELRP